MCLLPRETKGTGVSQRLAGIALVCIFLAAALLRFSGLDWGARSLEGYTRDGKPLAVNQAGFQPDAEAINQAATTLSEGIVPTHVYGGQTYLFTSYGTVFLYLNRAAAVVGGAVLGFEPFGERVRDADLSRIAGRWVSAMACLVLVWIVWLIGRALFCVPGGLVCVGLAALSPMSVQAAHFATVDGLLALWFGAALWASLRILVKGLTRDYILAGLFVGLAVATKLNGLFLFLPLTLAHLFRQGHPLDPTSVLQVIKSRNIWIASGVLVLTWVVLTPAAYLDPVGYFAPDFAGPYHVTFSLRKTAESPAAHRGWLHMEGASTYFYHPFHVFPTGLGWMVQVCLFAGMVLAAVRRDRSLGLIAISFIVYYLLVARLPDKPIRFFVPLLPFIVPLAVYAVHELVSMRRLRSVGVVFCLLILAESGIRSTALASVYRMTDSRVEAGHWVKLNVPHGGKLMMERGHNSLRGLVSITRLATLTADMGQEFANSRHENLAREGHYSAVLESEFLSQVDYLVLSDDRIPTRRVRAAADDYYTRLFDGKLGFKLDKSFPMKASFFGLELEDESTDLNWTRYDHPTTYVFKRVGEPELYAEHPELEVYRLRTWQHTREVIQRAQKPKDITFFKLSLPAKYKARVGERHLAQKFYAFLKDPASLTGADDQLTAIREGATWRIKMD